MNSLISKFGKIVFHFDGNNNDPDDIAALPVAAMLINSADLQDDTAFFYGNNLSENNDDSQVEKLRKSAKFAEKLGVGTFDYQSNIGATTNELVKIFNSGEKVLSIEGGPMEAVYRALEKTSSQNRQNITLLSHSWWNENRDVINRPGVTEARTWDDLKEDFPEVTFIDIDDQNPGFYNDGWNWLDQKNDPIFKEARELMISSYKRNDPSDSGMLFYALTGKENANPYDAKAFFEANPPSFDSAPQNNPTPTPQPTPNNPVFQAQNGQVIIEAENTWLQGEWKKVTIDGKESVLWDGERSNYSGVDNGETLSYTFKTDEAGTYHIAMNSARDRDVMNEDERWRGDTGNDAFVSVVEADTGKVVRSPVKFATYLGSSDKDLTWGNNFDINHNQVGAKVWLNDDTLYRLEVSGRSDGFLIDRITLSNDGFLKSTSIPQSSTTGDLPSPQPEPDPNIPSPSPSNNTYFIEAEDMNLSGDYHTENNQFASNGKVISLYGSDGDNDDTGAASFEFGGSTGVYTIKVNYFDENDGVGQMKVMQNDNLLKSWNLDRELGSHIADDKTKTSLEIKNIEVSAGDEFQIEGMEQGSVNTAEHVRIDGVEFILETNISSPPSPSSPPSSQPNKPFLIEAEDMMLSGDYHTENNQFASNGKVISLYSGDGNNNDTGAASFEFEGGTGLYKIVIDTFDENDGVGQIDIEQNGDRVASFKLDRELGSNLANDTTKTSLEIKDVFVSSGDEFRIEGMEQGNIYTGEHTRIDAVHFMPMSDM